MPWHFYYPIIIIILNRIDNRNVVHGYLNIVVKIICLIKCHLFVQLQSPKYAPPVEFVDQAALSPPDGYKDAGLQQALGGVLGSHIFGAQHIQQLQVIQRLQAKRAAMLAAQRSNSNGTSQSSSSSKVHPAPPPPPPPPSQSQPQTICTECAECTECAAKQEHDEGTSIK